MSQTPFTVNPALTAIAQEYGNGRGREYIADQVVPRARVDAPLFRYATFNIGDGYEVEDTTASRRGSLNEINVTAGEATGSVLDYGLKAAIPARDQLAAEGQSVGNWRNRMVRTLVDRVMLAREVRVAALIQTAGNYVTGQKSTLSGTTQWSDTANSDPVKAIMDAREAMLFTGNVGVTSLAVANTLRRHPKVSQALGGSQDSGRLVPLDEVATLLGLDRIIVGNSLKNTAKKGQTASTSQIWGKHFAILQIPPSAQGFGTATAPLIEYEQPAFAYSFQWGDVVAGEWMDSDMGLLGGEWVKYGEMLVEKIVAPEAGYLFTNAIA